MAFTPHQELTAAELNAALGISPNLDRIVCVGDSITEGNQDGTGVTYPGLLAAALPDVDVQNLGKSGWTSTEVAVRCGMPVRLGGSFTVPAGAGTSNQVTVSVAWPTESWRTNANIFPSWLGELRDGSTVIPGRLRHQIDDGASPVNKWTFERTTVGVATSIGAGAIFVATEHAALLDGVLVINVGRNNSDAPDVVLRDIDAILTARLVNPGPAVVLPVQLSTSEVSGTAAWNRIRTLNEKIAAKFPGQWCDDLRYMIDRGMALTGLTPDTTSLTRQQVDLTMPTQLLYDLTHPNQYGYRAKASAVLDGIKRVAGVSNVPGTIDSTTPTAVGPLRWRADDLKAPIGRAVTGWADRNYDNSMAVTGGITVNQSNSRRCVRLDGTSGYLTVGIGRTQPVSVLICGSFRSLPAVQGGIAWSEGSPGAWFAAAPDGMLTLAAGATVSTAAGQVSAGTQQVFAAVLAGSSSLAGLATGTLATGDPGTNYFAQAVRIGYAYSTGAARYAPLDLYEVRIIPGALNASQIATIAQDMLYPVD